MIVDRKIGFKDFRSKLFFCVKACFLWGILAHGMMLFNKYSTHDDALLYTLCATTSSGRWMLDVMETLYTRVFGSWVHSTPVFNGFTTFFFIALMCALIMDILDIRHKVSGIALCGITVAFPVITSLLAFMYTAPYYMAGAAMGVLGVWVVSKSRKWYCVVLCILLCAGSIASYQANLPVFVSVFLMSMIKELSEAERFSFRQLARTGVFYAGILILSFLAYVVLNQVALRIAGAELTGYQGINTFGRTDLKGYWDRIVLAYKEFLFPTKNVSAYMYPVKTRTYYRLGWVAVACLCVILLLRKWKKHKLLGVSIFVLMLLIPLSTNFIYVMCGKNVYSLMMYGQVFFFVFLIWMADQFQAENENAVKLVRGAVGVLMILICVIYCRFDNICYLRAEFEQEHVKSYYTSLVSNIESTPGYDDDYPVVYINEFNKKPPIDIGGPDEKIVYITPYDDGFSVNNYNWRRIMRNWCGYEPVTLDEAAFLDHEEVKRMPCYPDDGSIRVIDETVVIKFADTP